MTCVNAVIISVSVYVSSYSIYDSTFADVFLVRTHQQINNTYLNSTSICIGGGGDVV